MMHFLRLLINISNNHHRNENFNNKLEQIILFLKEEIKQTFSNSEIFDIIKSNKILLVFLLDKEIITMDSYITKELENNPDYADFFIPELSSKEVGKNYFEKRQLGENDSYVCNLIRQDMVEEFVSFVNRTNLSLSSIIKRSTFETNSFLNENEPNLIEYAAFFGSIQIFRYLKYNNVKLEPKLWLYAIHSKSSELIHFLEENEIKPPNDDYMLCLEESIKCHHNDIAEYFINQMLLQVNKSSERIIDTIFKSSNYSFIPELLDKNDLFFYFCYYDYYKVVDVLLKLKDEDIKTKTEIFL